MKSAEAVIQLPSQARFLGPALVFIRAAAASCGLSTSGLNEIEVAAEEALTNVIKHAFEGNADETFKLSVRFTEEQFFITIHEKGMPYSPDRIAGYDPEKLEETQATDGLGLFLMKKMMDDVLFENLGREGKSLMLIKNIRGNGERTVLDDSKNNLLLANRPHSTSLSNVYENRPFIPEDALEISRCAYKAYGYTYEPYIYYPEQIVAMNQSGTLRSFVATDKETGEILGHLALKYKNGTDRIAEIGVAFVKPEYRRSGIFIGLHQICHQKATEWSLFGILARAVTNHIGSQKTADTMGYLACGVMLGLFPDDVDFKALTGKIRQKETGLLLYRPFLVTNKRTIYPPLRHKNIVLDLFRSFEIPVLCGEQSTEPLGGQSLIHTEIVPVLNSADIEVIAIGGDIRHELESVIHSHCLKHVDAIFIYLDLEDSNSPFVVQQLEQRGFFFSGLLPFGLNGRHTLILQYMNNLAINYDIIKPYADSAQELLRYVRSCDPGYRESQQTEGEQK